jgi:hypothetical protein
MLYEFKSKATGTVVMTGPVAERMLAIIGKDAGPKGIITVEQLGPAIEALQQAVERDRAEGQPPETNEPADRDGRDGRDDTAADSHRAVSLSQRAWPLLEMMNAARSANQPITWGV